MTDTADVVTWKYVLTCWDEDVGHEKWTSGMLAGVKSGKYRFGYYSHYLDCLVGLSEPFEVR